MGRQLMAAGGAAVNYAGRKGRKKGVISVKPEEWVPKNKPDLLFTGKSGASGKTALVTKGFKPFLFFSYKRSSLNA